MKEPGSRPSPRGEPRRPSGDLRSPDSSGSPASTPASPVPPGDTPSDLTPGRATPRSDRLTPGGGRRGAERLPEKGGRKLQLLGVGGFGEVWKVRYLNSEEAWKYLAKGHGSDIQAFREAFNSRLINHPNVVRIQDVDEDENYYIIRMDYVRGRDLHRVVSEDGVLTPEKACRYAIQVAGALEAAHAVDVLHLDLKPSNIILKEDGDTVMITDFGLSATLTEGFFQVTSETSQGTRYFLAPEQLGAKESGVKPGPEVDVWAMGITFYYLLCREYPFDFTEKGQAVILEEPPRPIREIAPYIDDELWAILERMLRRDVGGRYRSMGEVRAAFADYWETITCPICQRSFRLEHVHGLCPGEGCEDPKRVVALKQSRLLMREGHEHFASSRHGEAIECYRKVIQLEDSPEGETAEVAERLATVAESHRAELERRVADIQRHRDEGDLLRTAKEIHAGRRRFSTSRALLDLREETERAILDLYRGMPDATKRAVRETRFAEAKLLLAQVEGFLDFPPVRRVLDEWNAEQGRPVSAVKELFNFVDERERFFKKCHLELKKRVDSLEMAAAISCLERLQRYFPDPKHLETIRVYGELEEILRFRETCDLEALRKSLESGGEPSLEGADELSLVRRRSESVLESLGAAESPARSEMARILKEAQCVTQLIVERRDRLLKELEAADHEGGLRARVEALRQLVAIAERTDVLAPEEAARYQGRHREAAQLLQRAEKKLREATELYDQGKYQAAQIAFEAAERDAPGEFPDISARLRECQERIDHDAELRADVLQVHNRLMGDAFTLDDFRTYFELMEQFEGSQEARGGSGSEQRVSRVISRLLGLQSAELGRAEADAHRLEILAETTDVLAAVRPEMLIASFSEAGSDLNERFLEFFARIFSPLERVVPGRLNVEARIEHLRDVIAEMMRLQPLVECLSGLEYHPHPAERASKVLVNCRPAILRGPEPQERLGSLLTLHADLVELARDSSVRSRVERGATSIKRTIARLALERAAHYVFRFAKLAAIPVVTALAVGAVYHYYQSVAEKERRVEVTTRLVREFLGDSEIELPSDKRELVEANLPGAADFLKPVQSFQWNSEGWNELPESSFDFARQIGVAKRQLRALRDLRSDADPEEAEPWNRALERLETAGENGVRTKLLELVRGWIQEIAGKASTIDLALSPTTRLQEADTALEFVEHLGKGVKQEGDPFSQAETWRGWIGTAITGLNSGSAKLPSGSEDASLLQLAHLARIAHLSQDLVRINTTIYQEFESEGKVEQFEDRLHKALQSLLDYRDELNKPTNEEVRKTVLGFEFVPAGEGTLRASVQEEIRRLLTDAPPASAGSAGS